MFHLWTLCILVAASSVAVLSQPYSLVKINTNGILKPRIVGGSKVNKIKPRIANGDRARTGDFPWHASLAIKYRSDHPSADPTFCSGAILNENWILAPAECVAGANSLRVDIGSVDINTPSVSVYPDGLTLHPEFNKNNFKNNIALLRLSGDNALNFDQDAAKGRYSPIRLPRRSQAHETFEGAEALFSGFGFPTQHSSNVSEHLLYAEQVVIPNTACVAYYGNDHELISSQVICAQSINARQGACMADSGAPLVINEFGRNTLIGLLSFVHNEGNCGRLAVPAAFTRITSYFDWIERVTQYRIRP